MRAAQAPLAVLATLLACTEAGETSRAAPPRPALGPAPLPAPLKEVDTEAFCVTCGALQTQSDGRALVESPKMRAVVNSPTGRVVDLHFTYLGPTRRLMALSSGMSRTQLGLKLFSHDACNLVYVIWRLLPQPGIVVSSKRNIDAKDSSACGNRGYRNIRAAREAPVPPVAPGEPHRLRVEHDEAALSVYADDTLAWQGQLDTSFPDALAGVTGVRSDNGRFIFKLQLSQDVPQDPRPGGPPACQASRASRNRIPEEE